jgi:hypothetical protein
MFTNRADDPGSACHPAPQVQDHPALWGGALMGSTFAKRVNDLDEEGFQALYGRWEPLEPAEVAARSRRMH